MADRSPEEIARKRIESARRRGAPELDLSNLGLATLPDAIASLTALQNLNLRNNELTALPDALASLLHDLGNVLNYDDKNDPYQLGDTNILNPKWVPDKPDVVVGYQHLLILEENGQTEYWPEGATQPYRVADLLNGIEEPGRRKEGRDRQRELEGSYKHSSEEARKAKSTEKREVQPAVSQSPLKMISGLVLLVIVLLAALVWLANQVGDNLPALGMLGVLAVLGIYPPMLFAALSTGLIDQNTFSKLSLGVLDKVSKLDPTKKDDKN